MGMQKTIYAWLALVASVALLTASCSSDEPDNGLLDQEAMLYINVNNTMRATETIEKMTPREVVEKAGGFKFTSYDNIDNCTMGISDEMKDYENERIKMWGEQVISSKGELVDAFIGARNIRVIGPDDRTGNEAIIAYIPNATMVKAEKEIKEAYRAGNYDLVYKLFQDAYTAIPTTYAEYRELVSKGLN